MRAAGATVEHVRGALPPGLPDEQWLKEIGERGWIVLMRDKAIRRRPLELQALKDGAVGAFVFTGGQATAQTTADAVTPKLTKMAAISISEPKPFLYSLTLGGTLSKVALR
jgi:PIN like domain